VRKAASLGAVSVIAAPEVEVEWPEEEVRDEERIGGRTGWC